MLDTHGTSVILDDLAYDREPDAAATRAAAVRRGPSLERPPDRLAFGRINAPAFVDHDQANDVAGLHRETNGLSWRTILHRVVQQVEKHLAECAGAERRHGMARARDIHHDPGATRSRQRPELGRDRGGLVRDPHPLVRRQLLPAAAGA
jgi:hypothetical protein